MKMKFEGIDSWYCPVYSDENGKLWCDVNNLNRVIPEGSYKANENGDIFVDSDEIVWATLNSKVGNAFDGEPLAPMRNTELQFM